MPVQSRKTERIEVRVRPSDKVFIEEAAEHLGISLSDFVISTLRERANTVIRRYTEINLNREQSIKFSNALLDTRPANDALKEAFKLHESLVEPE